VPCPAKAVSGQKIPDDLARVIDAWNHLPEAIKAGILALVNATGGARG
jgi:hypothetical protein